MLSFGGGKIYQDNFSLVGRFLVVFPFLHDGFGEGLGVAVHSQEDMVLAVLAGLVDV